MTGRPWTLAGAVAGLAAVAMAAAAAHALPERLDAAALQQVRDAVQLQGWHAIMLVVCGLWATRGGGMLAHAAAAAFLAGLVLFCGAVYALALGGIRLPLAAPAGGFLLMGGWLLVGAAALRG